MATIVIPKLPGSIVKRVEGSRKFHTIHIEERVFTIQKNGTSVVAFRRMNDIVRFSKMIESHYDLMREWPVINFEDTLMYKNTKTNKLKYVEIKDWDENILIAWCIRNTFSMLDIHIFEGDNRLVGRSIYWDALDDEFYKKLLNQRLSQNE